MYCKLHNFIFLCKFFFKFALKTPKIFRGLKPDLQVTWQVSNFSIAWMAQVQLDIFLIDITNENTFVSSDFHSNKKPFINNLKGYLVSCPVHTSKH